MFKKLRNQRTRRKDRRVIAALIRHYNQFKKVFSNSEVKSV